MMQRGVEIRPEVEPPFADHPFYRWESPEALHRAIIEADRHLSVGSLVYVPAKEIAGVAESAIVGAAPPTAHSFDAPYTGYVN